MFTTIIATLTALLASGSRTALRAVRSALWALECLHGTASKETTANAVAKAFELLSELEDSLGRRKDGADPLCSTDVADGEDDFFANEPDDDSLDEGRDDVVLGHVRRGDLSIKQLESLVMCLRALLIERVATEEDILGDGESPRLRERLIPRRHMPRGLRLARKEAAKLAYQLGQGMPRDKVGRIIVTGEPCRGERREASLKAFTLAFSVCMLAVEKVRQTGWVGVEHHFYADQQLDIEALAREIRRDAALGQRPPVIDDVQEVARQWDIGADGVPMDPDGVPVDPYWEGREGYRPADDRVDVTWLRSFVSNGVRHLVPAFSWRENGRSEPGHWEPIGSEHPAMVFAWAAVKATSAWREWRRELAGRVQRWGGEGGRVVLPERMPDADWCSTHRPGHEAWRLLKQDAAHVGDAGWEPSAPARAVGAALRALLAPVVTRRDDDGEEVKVARPLDPEARERLLAKLARYASKGGKGTGSLWRDALAATVRALAAIDGFGPRPDGPAPKRAPWSERRKAGPALPYGWHEADPAKHAELLELGRWARLGSGADDGEAYEAGDDGTFEAPAGPRAGRWARERHAILAAWRRTDPALAIELADAFGPAASLVYRAPVAMSGKRRFIVPAGPGPVIPGPARKAAPAPEPTEAPAPRRNPAGWVTVEPERTVIRWGGVKMPRRPVAPHGWEVRREERRAARVARALAYRAELDAEQERTAARLAREAERAALFDTMVWDIRAGIAIAHKWAVHPALREALVAPIRERVRHVRRELFGRK